MIIVPLATDTIETADGLPYKVVSFTNYKPEGPAVLVERDGTSEQQTVFFQDINTINGQKVNFVKNKQGYKVFEIDGYIERKFQLPQPNDIVLSKVLAGTSTRFKVYKVKLHVKDRSSQGIILETHEQDSDEMTEITLSQIDDIEKTIFSKTAFLSFYSDYSEKGAE